MNRLDRRALASAKRRGQDTVVHHILVGDGSVVSARVPVRDFAGAGNHEVAAPRGNPALNEPHWMKADLQEGNP